MLFHLYALDIPAYSLESSHVYPFLVTQTDQVLHYRASFSLTFLLPRMFISLYIVAFFFLFSIFQINNPLLRAPFQGSFLFFPPSTQATSFPM